MADFTLSYGPDIVTGTDGDDTVYGTGRGSFFPTLDPGDSLTAGRAPIRWCSSPTTQEE